MAFYFLKIIMIETISFESTNSGPHILMLGSIHGDEKCGTVAIDDAISKFRSGEWEILAGKITFLPRANLAAYNADKRFIEYNLNRIFGPREIISEEHKVAKMIEKHIQDADYLIDFHSVYSGDTPFVFIETPDETMRNLTKKISVPYIMTGWDKIYEATDDVDTVTFSNSVGTPGITVECGSHKTEESIIVAKTVLRESLEFFGIIASKNLQKSHENKDFIEVKELFRRPENAEFVKNWKNFDKITK